MHETARGPPLFLRATGCRLVQVRTRSCQPLGGAVCRVGGRQGPALASFRNSAIFCRGSGLAERTDGQVCALFSSTCASAGVGTWETCGFSWPVPLADPEVTPHSSTQPLAERLGTPWVRDTGLVYVWVPLWSRQLYTCFGYRICNCSSPFCGRVGAGRHLIRKTERGRVELGARWFWGQRKLLFPFTSHLPFLGCCFAPSSLV